jgi:hypothetical protein
MIQTARLRRTWSRRFCSRWLELARLAVTTSAVCPRRLYPYITDMTGVSSSWWSYGLRWARGFGERRAITPSDERFDDLIRRSATCLGGKQSNSRISRSLLCLVELRPGEVQQHYIRAFLHSLEDNFSEQRLIQRAAYSGNCSTVVDLPAPSIQVLHPFPLQVY